MVENNNNEDQAKLEAERKRLFEEMMANVHKQNEEYGPDGKATQRLQQEADIRAKKQQERDSITFNKFKYCILIFILLAIPFFMAGKVLLSASIIIFGLILSIVIAYNYNSTEEDKEIKKALQNANFDVLRIIKASGPSGYASIAVSPKGGTCVVRFGKVESYFTVGYAEIDIDSHSETKTNRMNQAAGAIIGSALAGPPGTIIGGLSGSTTTTEKINSISLRFDINGQPYEKYFLKSETTKGSGIYNNAINEARYWKSILKKVKIKSND